MPQEAPHFCEEHAMSDQPVNVLFLCTHNSARSILAEALLNHLGRGAFRAFSAGSSPRDNQRPTPLALKALEQAGVAIEGSRSKSWDEFAVPGAPSMDLTNDSPLHGPADVPRRSLRIG